MELQFHKNMAILHNRFVKLICVLILLFRWIIIFVN
jgi:hypothetical protein